MNLREDVIDIIVPFYKSEKGIANLERLKQSVKTFNPGFPYRLLVAEGPGTCAQNRNLGLLHSDTRYVCMCDDDVEFIEENWLGKAFSIFKTLSKIGLVGFRIENANRKVVESGISFIFDKEKEINLSIKVLDLKNGIEFQNGFYAIVPSACMVFDRTIAGFFAEKIYVGCINGEDVDYQLTIWGNGFRIFYLGEVGIVHHQKSESLRIKEYKDPNLAINHIIFARRWNVFPAKISKGKNEQ